MTITELLTTCATLGIAFRLVEDTPRASAPPGVMTPELLAALRAHKPAIREALLLRDRVAALPPPDPRATSTVEDGRRPLPECCPCGGSWLYVKRTALCLDCGATVDLPQSPPPPSSRREGAVSGPGMRHPTCQGGYPHHDIREDDGVVRCARCDGVAP